MYVNAYTIYKGDGGFLPQMCYIAELRILRSCIASYLQLKLAFNSISIRTYANVMLVICFIR